VLRQNAERVIEIEAAPGRGTDHLLQLLASLEQASHHVLADSIIRAARDRQLVLSHPHDVHEHRGAGLKGRVENTSIAAGSRAFALADKPLPNWAQNGEDRYRDAPVLRVFVTLGKHLAGVFTFGDALRADAHDALANLRSAGITRMVMLTGDDGAAAKRISSMLDLDVIVADAVPADKVATVEAEKATAPTMMVGDGINDAPALAAATVGIAMGARGATASSEAADVVVLADRLKPVADAVRIAQRTRAIALQSIVVGLALSAVAMVAAAMGQITPVAGALLQEGIDVAVILNALRTLGDGRLGRA
jgi:cation transport ATPase